MQLVSTGTSRFYVCSEAARTDAIQRTHSRRSHGGNQIRRSCMRQPMILHSRYTKSKNFPAQHLFSALTPCIRLCLSIATNQNRDLTDPTLETTNLICKFAFRWPLFPHIELCILCNSNMPRFDITTIISIISCFLAYTQASPTVDLSVRAAPSSLVSASGRTGISCFEAELWNSRLADTRSCIRAIHKLPENPESQVFFNGVLDDGFRLPFIAVHGSCAATVSMYGGNVIQRSSWDHIKFVLNAVTSVCSIGQYPMGSSGGIAWVGSERYIRVSIEKYRPLVNSSINDGHNSIATA